MDRDFTKRQPAEPVRRSQAYQAWSDIRARSVVEFVNAVAKELGGPSNPDLREQLYNAVFRNGDEPVSWHGTTYTGPMLLDVWRRASAAGHVTNKRGSYDRQDR